MSDRALDSGKFEDGSAASPSIGFNSHPGRGLYKTSTGGVGVAVDGSVVGAWSSTGLAVTGVVSATGLMGVKQAITNVTDALPTQAEMVTALGAANQGTGLIGVIKDNDADTNFFICLSNGVSWYALKLTKGA